MAIILALEYLYDAVSARMIAESTLAAGAFTFGWREPPKQDGPSRRIVFTPGAPDGGLGALGPARYPGPQPGHLEIGRTLATLGELFTVRILAEIEGTDIGGVGLEANDRVQYEQVRLLYDSFIRALYLAAHGNFGDGKALQIVDQRWVTTRAEKRFGAAIQLTCAIQATIPDLPYTPTAQSPSIEDTESLGSTADSPVITP